METFSITVSGETYIVEPALHAGFYTIKSRNKSALIGKNLQGEWELSMQTAEATNLPLAAIGEAIDERARL